MKSKRKRLNSSGIHYLHCVHRGINRLPKTLSSYARALADQTGWSSLFSPADPTLVTVVKLLHTGQSFEFIWDAQRTYQSSSSHVGSVPGSNLEFDSFLGPDDWGNGIIAKWDTFLHNVYRT